MGGQSWLRFDNILLKRTNRPNENEPSGPIRNFDFSIFKIDKIRKVLTDFFYFFIF